MHRRTFVQTLCLGGLATLSAPVVTFGQVRQPGRFVFVLLRGGVDGLAAVVPHGDPDYAATRGALALEVRNLVPLDDTFALAPGLASLRELWEADELAVLHALAIPYRTRSHFDGQAVLETGLDGPAGAADGWLNRVLQVLEGQRSAIAIAAGVPRSLAGPHDVQTWSPAQLGVVDEGYLARLAVLYRADTTLAGRFDLALRQESVVGEGTTARGNAAGGATTALFEATARILTQDGAPNIAALEFSGWDTHANQGVADGALDRRLAQLAEGLLAFRTAMADTWAGTTVVVMTEFGRTARPNGTRGTDHGTAGAGFVLGTTLARAAVLADWPGLSNASLFDGRDLRPTLDTRTVLRAALAGTFDMTEAQLGRVFPGTTGSRDPLALMR